ncbi:hypothetical protein GALL_428020 [mine drainage metagenome]|uniref:Uncharacterized protein n=1 Tax=mine drainage metagenome TaxID=410659 RepID=A0A1J5Q6M8_9ZZZZ
MAGQHVEPVNLAREFRGKRAKRGVFGFRNMQRRASSICPGHGANLMFAQEVAALAQQHRMAHCVGDLRQFCSGHTQQVDVNAHERFVDDVQAGFGQQRVNIRDPAIGGVLHRQHGKGAIALSHKLYRVLKGAAGHRLHFWARLAAGLMGIGSKLPLEGNTTGHVYWFLQANTRFGQLVALSIP